MRELPPRLLLDGDEDDEIVVELGGERRALGHDPFDAGVEPDPLLERMDDIARLLARAEASLLAPRPQPARPLASVPGPSTARPRPRWAATPRLAEIELIERASLLERLLPEADRRRLAALDHLVDGEVPYDRFGFSPGAARAAFPLFYALYRLYFRVESRGHENVPAEGPTILAANHAGVLPFDGAMAVLDVLLHTDPPRLPRAVVDRWAGSLPFVNVFFARVGQVIGTRENFTDLLEDGQCLLVFPEGMSGVAKRITQRYRLQRFHPGFVEQSLRSRAPIVPMAILGSDDQMPVLFDLGGLAKRIGLPMLPITPTFPWLGPLGLLPYPVRYRIVYGEPLAFHERFGPEAADDARLVQHLTQQVRRTVQQLMDRNR
jgi:1-acyl-sn-glycerol-3-phosphate acyltransferase